MPEQRDQMGQILFILGEVRSKVENIEQEIVGTEQLPGLRKRVEGLEATENKRTGALAVLGVLWGGVEAWVHFFKGGGGTGH